MITVSDDGMVNIPNELILFHARFHKAEPLPFGWHVFVLNSFETLQELRAAHGDPDQTDAYAWTQIYDQPDAELSIGTIYFAAGWVYVGMVAHEAMHLASWMCRFPEDAWPERGRLRARPRRMTLGREPEALAEYTGTLTSVMWYNLEADGMTTVDVLPRASVEADR